jgi:hypothetical protein
MCNAAVLKLKLGGPDGASELVRPLCGLMITKEGGSELCWMYVAPHGYGIPVFLLLEKALAFVRIGPRVGLASAMKWTYYELTEDGLAADTRRLAAAGVDVTICDETQVDCAVAYDFAPGDKLTQWSGVINSWFMVNLYLAPDFVALAVLALKFLGLPLGALFARATRGTDVVSVMLCGCLR